MEEAVLNEIERYPETSTRKIAHELNITHVTVWQILRHQQLYPYHMQQVQALIPRDLPLRVDFCNWLRNQILRNPNFLSQVLFTDEACFSRNGITYGLRIIHTPSLNIISKNSFLSIFGLEL
nr:unnamed protein product [Callosobruchus chinensis]